MRFTLGNDVDELGVSFPPDMMDTGPATESLAAEDLLQQLSRDLGLPDFMEEDASSSSAFSDHLVADPFTVEGRTHGHVSTDAMLCPSSCASPKSEPLSPSPPSSRRAHSIDSMSSGSSHPPSPSSSDHSDHATAATNLAFEASLSPPNSSRAASSRWPPTQGTTAAPPQPPWQLLLW